MDINDYRQLVIDLNKQLKEKDKIILKLEENLIIYRLSKKKY